MNGEAIKAGTLTVLPRLQMCYQVERQIRWHMKQCAGADLVKWQAASIVIQDKIAELEALVAEAFELDAYRGKRILST